MPTIERRPPVALAILAAFAAGSCLGLHASAQQTTGSPAPTRVRIATFNTSLNRNAAGQLAHELATGDSPQARRVAEVLRRVRPDVVLLNEFDFDSDGKAIEAFQKNYLEKGPTDAPPLRLTYRFLAEVNTGVPSGMDLDQDGSTQGPQDCYGFGRHEGQFGMVVLSRYPILRSQVRTFRKFLWSDMPRARQPRVHGKAFYPPATWRRLRLSSKSIWDLPIAMGEETVHLIASHPTPPVFDGPEDRNGDRNHDEIRFLADYVSAGRGDYCRDDSGRMGGVEPRAHFVIVGDLNADPNDGDSTGNPIQQLLRSPRIDQRSAPRSRGARRAAEHGGANKLHRGPHACDTASFPAKNVGNLRVDYVLPSKSLKTLDSAVYWPTDDLPQADLLKASDHRLVWVDVAVD